MYTYISHWLSIIKAVLAGKELVVHPTVIQQAMMQHANESVLLLCIHSAESHIRQMITASSLPGLPRCVPRAGLSPDCGLYPWGKKHYQQDRALAIFPTGQSVDTTYTKPLISEYSCPMMPPCSLAWYLTLKRHESINIVYLKCGREIHTPEPGRRLRRACT